MNDNSIVQLEFDLDSTLEEKNDSVGYDLWQHQRRQAYDKVAGIWHLPLHKKVRVKLKWRPDELVGTLTLQEMPKKLSSKIPLNLRVDCFDFDSTEIEYCKRIE